MHFEVLLYVLMNRSMLVGKFTKYTSTGHAPMKTPDRVLLNTATMAVACAGCRRARQGVPLPQVALPEEVLRVLPGQRALHRRMQVSLLPGFHHVPATAMALALRIGFTEAAEACVKHQKHSI